MSAVRRIAVCAVAVLGLAWSFSRPARPQEEGSKPRIVLEVLHSHATAVVSGREVHVPRQGPHGPRTLRETRANPRPSVQVRLRALEGPSIPEVLAVAPVTIACATGEKLWFDNLGWNRVRVTFQRHAFAWRIFVEPLAETGQTSPGQVRMRGRDRGLSRLARRSGRGDPSPTARHLPARARGRASDLTEKTSADESEGSPSLQGRGGIRPPRA
jgi:hypothetical protein